MFFCCPVYADDSVIFCNGADINLEIYGFVNELENITENTPFDDIIEKSETIIEKNKDNLIVKIIKKISDSIFSFLNRILEKASESILEMINSHEEFKIIE